MELNGVAIKKQAPNFATAQKVFEGKAGLSTKDHLQQQAEKVISYDNFKKSILDQQKDYPLPEPVLSVSVDGKLFPLMTLRSFTLWQGKQKSKKTTALALAVSAFLMKDETKEGIQIVRNIEGSVIWFDNEQGESYAARTMKLILKLANLVNTPQLVYCDLREYSPTERQGIIQAAIENTPDVKLVIIDGLVDLMNDFMDAAEGHGIVIHLLKLASAHNIHVAGVLHQNKADKNARAHIGTIASQKCEFEISTEVDNEDRSQSIVSCLNSRGLPFEPFAIRWDAGSLPCICQDWKTTVDEVAERKAKRNIERAKEIAEAVFKPLASLTHAEAINGIMNEAGKSKSTAKTYLGDLQGWRLVNKGDDGRYRIVAKEVKVNEGQKEG